MARKIVLLFLIASSFVYGMATVQYKVFPYELILVLKESVSPKKSEYGTHYLHRSSFFSSFGVTRSDVVFVGDSITEGAEWSEVFPDITVVNRGIGGDTTDGVINRIESIINTGASKAFVMLGVNDIYKGKKHGYVFANYKKIVEDMELSGMDVYIQSTLLTSNEDWNSEINKLNLLLEDFAASKSIKFIDVNKFTASGGKMNPLYSLDGVHLNDKGYDQWIGVIKQYLNK